MSKENGGERLLEVRDLSVFFEGPLDSARILNQISFHIDRGEILGIVGESGCGKSMTAMSVLRLLQSPPARIEGSIRFDGVDLLSLGKREMRRIRGNRISMIFQEPMTSLNPVMTVGEQLREALRIHQGLRGEALRRRVVEALGMVGVADPESRVRSYPHEMSGGMRQRVMIAMAMACRPDLLIADEPTTALDVTIQAQVLELMRELSVQTGTALMLITHDLSVIAQMCSRVLVFYCGEIVEQAPVRQLLEEPRHPYTQGLLASLPQRGVYGDLNIIPGQVPKASDFPAGCVFAPRCARAGGRCFAEKPPMTASGSGGVRCWAYGPQEGAGGNV